MRNFVVIGLGSFGRCVLKGLAARNLEVLVIDRDAEKIQEVRDLATDAITADVLNRQLFEEMLPDGIECAIIDLGAEMHASILVTHHLTKLDVPNIVVEAINAEQAEILEIIGGDRVRIVYPEEEAAERMVGQLAGRGIIDFFTVRGDFSMIEVPVPSEWVGQNVVELDLRRNLDLSVVAVRNKADAEGPCWRFPAPDLPFEEDDVVLLAGRDEALHKVDH